MVDAGSQAGAGIAEALALADKVWGVGPPVPGPDGRAAFVIRSKLRPEDEAAESIGKHGLRGEIIDPATATAEKLFPKGTRIRVTAGPFFGYYGMVKNAYNHHRPHGALDGLTPSEYLKICRDRKAPPSHMS